MPRRAFAVQRNSPVRRRVSTQRRTKIVRNPSYRQQTVRSATVTNSGTVATAPTISYTSTGSYGSVYFTNATAGKTVWLNLALVNGDVLSVDFSARTVTLNGATIANALTVDSRWWDLAPGANTITSNVPATVTHRSAS